MVYISPSAYQPRQIFFISYSIPKMYINPSSVTEEHASYKPKTPFEWAAQALLQANSNPTKSIAKRELLRGVELRPGRDDINLFQPQNCEAALAYSRGQVLDGAQACRDCKRGRGPFTKCIVLSGFLKGSCSNCHYNAEGARCNLRRAEEPLHTTPAGSQREPSIEIVDDTTDHEVRRYTKATRIQRIAGLHKNVAILLEQANDLYEEIGMLNGRMT
jgi:hypothetical protein